MDDQRAGDWCPHCGSALERSRQPAGGRQGLHQKNNGLARWPKWLVACIDRVEFSSALRESDMFSEPIHLSANELFDVGSDHAITMSMKLTQENLWRFS